MFYIKFLTVWCLFGYSYGYFPQSSDSRKKDWWENTVFYQIYPRSFMDSNGDGVGDIKGITSKLNYLKETGITATWLSPIFESPMVDFGYDIKDFKKIHYEFGTMEDFDELIVKAKELGIKIILDFVPNHTSNQCDWFLKSIDRISIYEDYYIWHDGIENPNGNFKPLPPNNWVSVFGGSAWEWNEKRKQYYLHQFTKEQPDLNYRNDLVKNEMYEILKFWLDKGVDGFRVDAANHIYEDSQFPDEPISGKTLDNTNYDYLEHYFTKDLPENFELIYSFRNLLDEYKLKNGGDTRIMMTEAYANITFTMKFYNSDDGLKKGSQMPFNFLLITDLNDKSNSNDFVFTLNKWLNYMPLSESPNWVLGNHDRSRIASRFGKEKADLMNVLLLTLPGIAVIYYGDEIGMIDHIDIPWEETKDPNALNKNKLNFKEYSRDPVRTPFQWDDTKNTGFSTSSKTWIAVHPEYKENNLKKQKQSKLSHYNIVRDLIELRKLKSFTHGSFRSLAINSNVYTHIREYDGVKYVIVINLSKIKYSVNLKIMEIHSEYMTVILTGAHSNHKKGDRISTSSVSLGEHESLILLAQSDTSILDITTVSNWVILRNIIIGGIVLKLIINNFQNIIPKR